MYRSNGQYDVRQVEGPWANSTSTLSAVKILTCSAAQRRSYVVSNPSTVLAHVRGQTRLGVSSIARPLAFGQLTSRVVIVWPKSNSNTSLLSFYSFYCFSPTRAWNFNNSLLLDRFLWDELAKHLKSWWWRSPGPLARTPNEIMKANKRKKEEEKK